MNKLIKVTSIVLAVCASTEALSVETVVRPGQSLASIAKQHEGNYTLFQKIAAYARANPELFSDVNKIDQLRTGTKLNKPTMAHFKSDDDWYEKIVAKYKSHKNTKVVNKTAKPKTFRQQVFIESEVVVGDDETLVSDNLEDAQYDEVPDDMVDRAYSSNEDELLTDTDSLLTATESVTWPETDNQPSGRLSFVREADSTPLRRSEIDSRQVKPKPTIDSPLTSIRGEITVSASPANRSLSHSRPMELEDFDVFDSMISWTFSEGATFADALGRLSSFIGYTPIAENDDIDNVYRMPLPELHRNVKDVNVRTGLRMLGGPGMYVVLDHRKRTVGYKFRNWAPDPERQFKTCFEYGFVERVDEQYGYCSVTDEPCAF